MGTTIQVIYSLLVTLIFFIFGMLLIVSGKDNYAKGIIGAIVTALSALFFAIFTNYLPYIIDKTTEAIPELIIPAQTVISLLLLVVLLSLFPVLTLNPDWPRKKVATILVIPMVFLALVYLPFSIELVKETKLQNLFYISGNLRSLLQNLDHPDVFVRFILLILIFITPLAISYTTSLIHLSHKNRKPTSNYTTYYVSLSVLSVILMAYCLNLPYSKYLTEITLPIFLSVLLIGYYRNSSFLTKFVKSENSEEKEELPASGVKVSLSSADASFLDIWKRMDELVRNNDRFTDPELQVQTIADEMKINKNILNDSLYRMGFNSFKEYLNEIRLMRFKELAEKDHGGDITDMYESAGFSSKSTFYRIFNIEEGITPSEYMKKLSKFDNI